MHVYFDSVCVAHAMHTFKYNSKNKNMVFLIIINSIQVQFCVPAAQSNAVIHSIPRNTHSINCIACNVL